MNNKVRFIVLLLVGLSVGVHSLSVTAQAAPFSLDDLQPITVDNAADVTLLSVLGRGPIVKVLWVEDDIIVSAYTGIWLYDARDLAAPPRLLTSAYSGSMVAAAPGLVVTTSEGDNSLRFWDIDSAVELRTLDGFG